MFVCAKILDEGGLKYEVKKCGRALSRTKLKMKNRVTCEFVKLTHKKKSLG